MERFMCSKRTKTRSCKEKNQNKTSLITLLPEDVLMNCIARVPKQNYPILSNVCKLFRSMVASSELYARRSLLGCTESCIYVPIQSSDEPNIRWFTLHLSSRNNRLVPLGSLPPMPYSYLGRRYVVVGSKIFVLGGYYNGKPTSDVLTIDCRHDIAQPIGTMPKDVIYPVRDVVDGKIYVIGGRYSRENNNGFSSVWSSNKMMVLDTEARTWECEMSSGLESGRRLISSVSMQDKIYIKGSKNNSFVVEPKESKWVEEEVNADELVQYSSWRWENGCVIDGILYSFDTGRQCCLRAYDLKQRLFCGVVKGVEGLVKPCNKVCVASCGKNLILLMHNGDDEESEIWGAEIALLERNQKGEIWCKVEWCQLLLVGYTFTNCLTVVV